MGDVVNLNAFRKRQAREAMKDKAAENRAHHGRKRVAKQQAQKDQERAKARLDEKKLDPNATSHTTEDPKRGA